MLELRSLLHTKVLSLLELQVADLVSLYAASCGANRVYVVKNEPLELSLPAELRADSIPSKARALSLQWKCEIHSEFSFLLTSSKVITLFEGCTLEFRNHVFEACHSRDSRDQP